MTSRKSLAHTTTATLSEVIDCLKQHDVIAGIMLLGTTGTDDLTPTSDYDLLVVFSDPSVPLRIVNTWVDNRLTEIYCTTEPALNRILAEDATWADGSEEGTVLTWLREGRIAHDREGRLAAARERARDATPPSVAGNRESHDAWRKIGYNVARIKRYLDASDPVSITVIDMRLLYSVAEVNLHYFTVRRLPWRGEKPAIQHWMEHDPDYLAYLRQLSEEADWRQKMRLYEALAEHALAPLGGLWTRGDTVVSIGAGYGAEPSDLTPGTEQEAFTFWQGLV